MGELHENWKETQRPQCRVASLIPISFTFQKSNPLFSAVFITLFKSDWMPADSSSPFISRSAKESSCVPSKWGELHENWKEGPHCTVGYLIPIPFTFQKSNPLFFIVFYPCSNLFECRRIIMHYYSNISFVLRPMDWINRGMKEILVKSASLHWY